MTWWQAIAVAGSIALGVLAGLLFVRILFKKQSNSSSELASTKSTSIQLQPKADPLSKLVIEHKSAYNGQKARFENANKIPETVLPSAKAPQPVKLVPEYPNKEKPRNVPPVAPENKIVEPVVDKKTIKSRNGIFAEIESNLEIAAAHRVDKPILFQTKKWDANPDEMNEIPAKSRSEIGEVYINMRLANNLAWSISEFGDSTGELSNRYSDLCTGIAARLTNILNKI